MSQETQDASIAEEGVGEETLAEYLNGRRVLLSFPLSSITSSTSSRHLLTHKLHLPYTDARLLLISVAVACIPADRRRLTHLIRHDAAVPVSVM